MQKERLREEKAGAFFPSKGAAPDSSRCKAPPLEAALAQQFFAQRTARAAVLVA